MIDIFARYIDGILVCEPMKRRGMTKGEYLRALEASNKLNADGIPNSSKLVAFWPYRKAPDPALSLQLPLFEEMSTPEPEPTVIESRLDDARQPKQQVLSYKLEK